MCVPVIKTLSKLLTDACTGNQNIELRHENILYYCLFETNNEPNNGKTFFKFKVLPHTGSLVT